MSEAMLKPLAKKKFFRCLNPKCLQVEMGQFWSDASEKNPAVCPQCGIVGKQGTKFGHMIQRLTVVHFDPPTEIPGIGQNVRACETSRAIQADEMPNGIPNPYHAGTGSVQQVNCPECMATTAYIDACMTHDLSEEGVDTTRHALGRLDELSRGKRLVISK